MGVARRIETQTSFIKSTDNNLAILATDRTHDSRLQSVLSDLTGFANAAFTD